MKARRVVHPMLELRPYPWNETKATQERLNGFVSISIVLLIHDATGSDRARPSWNSGDWRTSDHHHLLYPTAGRRIWRQLLLWLADGTADAAGSDIPPVAASAMSLPAPSWHPRSAPFQSRRRRWVLARLSLWPMPALSPALGRYGAASRGRRLAKFWGLSGMLRVDH